MLSGVVYMTKSKGPRTACILEHVTKKVQLPVSIMYSCTVCMSSLLQTDVTTVVLHTWSGRLTPVIMLYALVTKSVDELVHLCTDSVP